MVWALSLSLATTQEIIVIFSSSAYLDVSVRQVRSYCAMSSTWRVSPFGNPRIESHLQIPAAYRSLSRPSSPPRAKASPVYSFLLSSDHAPFAPHVVLFDMSYCYNVSIVVCSSFLTSSNMSKNFSIPVRFRGRTIYWPFILGRVMVENNGVEPLTSCVQGRRSSQLS